MIFPGIDWKLSAVSSKIESPSIDRDVSENDCGLPGSKTCTAFDGLIVKSVKSIVGDNSEVEYSNETTGTHLTPEEFHAKLTEPNSILVDVRNSYEYAVGHFEGAINPKTRNFKSFDTWLDRAKEEKLFKGKENILMYCTGGIRCEKASIQLKRKLNLITETQDELNVKERSEKHEQSGSHEMLKVYQLKGGIHRYLEQYAHSANNLFRGKNFVFDKRVVQPISTPTQNIEGNADDDHNVIGRCHSCSASYDKIHDDRRCKKCRLLLLICDSCEATLQKSYWCEDHYYLDPAIYKENPDAIQELRQRVRNLDLKLNSDALKGRRQRQKRVPIQKRKQELLDLLSIVERSSF